MGWTYPDVLALPAAVHRELIAWINAGARPDRDDDDAR